MPENDKIKRKNHKDLSDISMTDETITVMGPLWESPHSEFGTS